MLKAEYRQRGPRPHELIHAVPLELHDLRPDEVKVEVLAAPIHPSDVLTITGEYGMLPDLPAVGGNEGVGRVRERGPNVTDLEVDQLVLLPTGSGTWRSHMIDKASRFVPLPEGDPLQMSMIAVNPPTASLLLSSFVDLQPGEWVIQNAANSAVGGYLTQLAATRDLKTVCLVRRPDAVDGVLAQGADVCLVDGPGLRSRVREATGNAAIRLGVDAVAGDATRRLASTLTKGATLVNYGGMSGEPCRIMPNSLIFHGLEVRGFWLAQWFRTASQEQRRDLFAEVARLVATGLLEAEVDATYPLEEIAAAVERAASDGRRGKVLVVPGPG